MYQQFSVLFSVEGQLQTQFPQYSYRLKKKCHCTKRGLKILRIYICQNSALKMTNGIRKVRLGVDIFEKKFLILVSSSLTQCFKIRPRLQQSFPCSQQSINQYNSAWCTPYQDSTFYFPCFWQDWRRKERERETPSSPFSR